MKRIAIIGAGASGLFLAKKLSGKKDLEVVVFEKNKQAGTKLRASGGGKCNLFNTYVDSDCLRFETLWPTVSSIFCGGAPYNT